MDALLKIRGAILGLLEEARGEKFVQSPPLSILYLILIYRKLRSSLEAEVDIIIPDSSWLAADGRLQNALLNNSKALLVFYFPTVFLAHMQAIFSARFSLSRTLM